MKRNSLAIFFLICTMALWAIPAERSRLKVKLTDGSELFVTTYGDEHYSWFLSDDGEVIEPMEENRRLFRRTGRKLDDAVAVSSARRSAVRRIGSQANAPLPATGSPKVPVILVSFADSVFSVGKTDEETRAYFDLFCNGTNDGTNYTGHGSYGSIKDYFIAQSDSLFSPEFVVIGPVQLDNPVATYGKNSGSSKDTGYSAFRKEAIAKAVANYDVDWGEFDNKGRGGGYVDMVFFIYAGCGENTVQVNPDLIWPKEATGSVSVTLDNGEKIVFATSACCCENRGVVQDGEVVAAKADGIGVMCHELSHALGLPDFYDTKGVAFGMDVWSLMDYGCYMINGYCPVGYTAYERDFMGWRKLQELTEAGPYTLAPIGDKEGVGLKVVNPENTNEYYILEARLNAGWDFRLARYGHGLQVTHVDYTSSAWNSNSVNVVADHQRLTIIAANNRYLATTATGDTREWLETWAGNLYPYVYEDEEGVTHCNDSLTANSVPVASVFSESGVMPHDITQISIDEENNRVSFMFDGHLYDAIHELSSATDFNTSSSASDCYDLSGRRVNGTLHKGFYVRDNRKIVIAH